MRVCVVGALTVGIALTVLAGASYAAGHVVGQTTSGYGAPQVLGEQFIKPQAASSAWGLWAGLGIAFLILFLSASYGWYRTHAAAES